MSTSRVFLVVPAAQLGLLLLAGSAGAIDLERLVMPGPVVAGHADIEGDCARCHPRMRKIEQKALCLECHEDVALDQSTSGGFHGLHPLATKADCRVCHPEHRGRDADIVALDAETFDHARTDYPLLGAHRSTACGDCHAENSAHRDAPDQCVDCHRDVDAHAGALGEGCVDCHEESAWSHARFDHEETSFPLTGAHLKADCALCHGGQRYEGVPTACGSCHRLDDVHRGRMGAECSSCHETGSWKETRFDHAAEANFALRGSHSRLACAACHSDTNKTDELPRDCLGCHRADDDHRGRFGSGCETCHGEDRWKPAHFDHAKTDFPLRGSHQEADCELCHRGTLFQEEIDDRCISCHQADDVHKGQQGSDCSRCHDELGWSAKVAFDHGLTAFPLLGLHASVSCEECHLTAAFKDADRQCAACHEADDGHEGSLGPNCGECHNPNGWKWWRFDHDQQTSFALHGAHEDLQCGSCHRTPTEGDVNLAQSCHSCHARDDAHSGQMGRRCDVCHGDTRWSEVNR